MWRRFLLFPFALLAGLFVLGAGVAALVLLLAYPNLPSLDALTDYQPKVPLRIYTADGELIGEFGEERRSVILPKSPRTSRTRSSPRKTSASINTPASTMPACCVPPTPT
jgi:membrane peptidoglycan carboxypeptidase